MLLCVRRCICLCLITSWTFVLIYDLLLCLFLRRLDGIQRLYFFFYESCHITVCKVVMQMFATSVAVQVMYAVYTLRFDPQKRKGAQPTLLLFSL